MRNAEIEKRVMACGKWRRIERAGGTKLQVKRFW